MRYAAFLRGINVGGHKPIKMADLGRIFASMGFTGVRTYIQSGNVVFDAVQPDPASLAVEIEAGLTAELGYDVATMLRTGRELQKIVDIHPFAALPPGDDAKPYVTFLRRPLAPDLTLPLISPKQDVEVFGGTEHALFSLSRQWNGRYGFPNQFIEDALGAVATTRNWNTVSKVASIINT